MAFLRSRDPLYGARRPRSDFRGQQRPDRVAVLPVLHRGRRRRQARRRAPGELLLQRRSGKRERPGERRRHRPAPRGAQRRPAHRPRALCDRGQPLHAAPDERPGVHRRAGNGMVRARRRRRAQAGVGGRQRRRLLRALHRRLARGDGALELAALPVRRVLRHHAQRRAVPHARGARHRPQRRRDAVGHLRLDADDSGQRRQLRPAVPDVRRHREVPRQVRARREPFGRRALRARVRLRRDQARSRAPSGRPPRRRGRSRAGKGDGALHRPVEEVHRAQAPARRAHRLPPGAAARRGPRLRAPRRALHLRGGQLPPDKLRGAGRVRPERFGDHGGVVRRVPPESSPTRSATRTRCPTS